MDNNFGEIYKQDEELAGNIKIIASSDETGKRRAFIIGSPRSDYHSTWYEISITFGKEQQTDYPELQFLTKVIHPNVYRDGFVCSKFVQDHWLPTRTVSQLLLDVSKLLEAPNMDYVVQETRKSIFSIFQTHKRSAQRLVNTWKLKKNNAFEMLHIK